jgi:mannose-6-phosphate isomerase-like protein (cupin superfamily)
MLENINHDGRLLAIIIYSNYEAEGIKFFTSDDFTQQLAYMNRPQGYVIKPHIHNSVKREVQFTKEVLFIKSGKVRVDFYDDQKNYLVSRIINKGDVILLAFGGHGFEMIEDSEIIEVKQGPYAGEADKIRFNPVPSDLIKLKEF